MALKLRKPLSPKVMDELSKFVRKEEEEEEYEEMGEEEEEEEEEIILTENNNQRVIPTTFERDGPSSLTNVNTCVTFSQRMSPLHDFVSNPTEEIDVDLPLSQIFLSDDKGHRHRLRFSAVFRTMKPIFLKFRSLTPKNIGDEQAQTTGSYFYERMHIPWTRRLVFRKKYRISDETQEHEHTRTAEFRSKMKKLKLQLDKQRNALPKTSMSVIFMKMNGMVVRFKTKSLIAIEQAVVSKETISKYYEGNYAHLLSVNNNDIVLVILEIINPVIEPMVPIKETSINTHDKMIHIKYKCVTRKTNFYSIPFSTLTYYNPQKRSFPLDYVKKPPKWIKEVRRERTGNTKKTKRETHLQQCSAVETSWFALQIRRLRVRAQSRVFDMMILYDREKYEKWILDIQSTRVSNEERGRRPITECNVCRTFEMMSLEKKRIYDRSRTQDAKKYFKLPEESGCYRSLSCETLDL